jgi:hypothetical protein
MFWSLFGPYKTIHKLCLGTLLIKFTRNKNRNLFIYCRLKL